MKFDKYLGISEAARKVMLKLNQRGFNITKSLRDSNGIFLSSSAWYNGREQGICLVAYNGKESLVITFGEHRNSDSIFVDTWKLETFFFNPPKIDDMPDKAYEERKFFKPDDHSKAERFIRTLVRDFIEQTRREAVANAKRSS